MRLDAEKSWKGAWGLSLQSRSPNPCVQVTSSHPVSWVAVSCPWSKTCIHSFLTLLALQQVKVQLSFEKHLCNCVVGVVCSGRRLLSTSSSSSSSTHLTLHTVTGRDRERKDPSRFSLPMSIGAAKGAFGRISVGHLKYVFTLLTSRKSSPEFTRISDLSTLHANPTPGAGAGPGEGVCGNSAFYPAIRWAQG